MCAYDCVMWRRITETRRVARPRSPRLRALALRRSGGAPSKRARARVSFVGQRRRQAAQLREDRLLAAEGQADDLVGLGHDVRRRAMGQTHLRLGVALGLGLGLGLWVRVRDRVRAVG